MDLVKNLLHASAYDEACLAEQPAYTVIERLRASIDYEHEKLVLKNMQEACRLQAQKIWVMEKRFGFPPSDLPY